MDGGGGEGMGVCESSNLVIIMCIIRKLVITRRIRRLDVMPNLRYLKIPSTEQAKLFKSYYVRRNDT